MNPIEIESRFKDEKKSASAVSQQFARVAISSPYLTVENINAMARIGIQFEDVQRAVEMLIQRGDTPSVQRIRDVLGTGSFTTISDHLREWRSRRDENRDIPLPQNVPERLQEALVVLWQQAQDEASEGLAFYRKQADESIEQARAEAEQAQRRVEDTQQRFAALNEQLNVAQARLEEKTTQIARVESQLDQIQLKLLERDQQLQESTEQFARLKEEKELLNTHHQQALEEQEELYQQRIKQEETRHEAAESRLMHLLDSTRSEKADIEKQARRQAEQMTERLDRLTAQTEEARRSLLDEERRHRDLVAHSQQIEQALAETRSHNEALESELVTRNEELNRLRTELRVQQERASRAPVPPYLY